MPLRTVEQYKKSLKDGRKVYVVGERVQDVTTHPILKITIDHSSNIFQYTHDRHYRSLFTFTSPETGDRVSRYFMFPKNGRELQLRNSLIEEHTRLGNSTLNLVQTIGSDALMALTTVTEQMDKALETDYLERVKKYTSYCRENDLAMVVAQTDVKGDRSLHPGEQTDPDQYVHIVKQRRDGIVVRGAKAHTTGAPSANEIIVVPTRNLSEAEKDYAVAFAVPVNTPGVVLICRPTGSIEQSAFDYPISRKNVETETITVFDDVFVPWERVFMAGETKFAGALALTFANHHRFTAISYKPPLGDLFIGAAQLIAEANGIGSVPHVREKIARLIAYTEVIRACSKVAALECEISPSGIAMPNVVYTNVAKYHFASMYHEMTALLQDIAGGLIVTAPTGRDFQNPETKGYLEKYLASNVKVPTEQRLRLFHLIRDLTASEFGGYNQVLAIHAEGSLQAQMITMYRDYDIERCVNLVKKALDIR